MVVVILTLISNRKSLGGKARTEDEVKVVKFFRAKIVRILGCDSLQNGSRLGSSRSKLGQFIPDLEIAFRYRSSMRMYRYQVWDKTEMNILEYDTSWYGFYTSPIRRDYVTTDRERQTIPRASVEHAYDELHFLTAHRYFATSRICTELKTMTHRIHATQTSYLDYHRTLRYDITLFAWYVVKSQILISQISTVQCRYQDKCSRALDLLRGRGICTTTHGLARIKD